MSIETAIYTYLGGIGAVTALVSSRIYPVQAPQGSVLPYVIQTRVSTRRSPGISRPSGMVRARMQLDAYAATPDGAQAVADVLRDNLDGWRGATMGAEYVVSVNLDDEDVGFTPPSDGGDPGVYRISADYIFLFGETGTAV